MLHLLKQLELEAEEVEVALEREDMPDIMPFLARAEAVASDSIITSIISIYHRDASILFDQGSTYSYVSFYFSPCLGIYWDLLSSHFYVSTPVEDSLIVGCVY